VFLEEKSKDTAGAEVQDAVIVRIADGSGSGVDLTVQAPALTATTQGSDTMTSDNSVTEYYDRYGTYAMYDSDSQGLVEITYPDNQAIAKIAVGTAPTFGTSGTGGTVETAVKIKNPVSKLASEINTASLSGDLILIGGPCANSLVAELVEDGSLTATGETLTCAGWTPTKGIIKEVSDAFGSGQKALVVAGTTADDTRSLAANNKGLANHMGS
jgi:S-layer protein (TIGR01564 family)